jgi:HDOD domain
MHRYTAAGRLPLEVQESRSLPILSRMLVAGILIAGLLVLAGWLARGRLGQPGRQVRPGREAAVRSEPAPAHTNPSADVAKIAAASNAAAQRLWRLAFGALPEAPPLPRAHARVRDLVCAVLELDELDPRYFPRRPTLLPQLLQAVNDPRAESDKISRMIAHDPVLTADVLRLANSSLYRTSPAPIETIQRAIVVCGVDALRGILAGAMLQPVFRASRTNFPRLPRMLWDRTERGSRAAELYAAKVNPQDRFEAQLVVLLSALGPLVVYSATLDGYSRAIRLAPSPALFVELIGTLGPKMSLRIARDWQASPRLLAALAGSGDGLLAAALHLGELLGTLSLLESQTIISSDERIASLQAAGLTESSIGDIWQRLVGRPVAHDGPGEL